MTAADYIPSRPTLSRLRAAVQESQGCELYRHATQAVFSSAARQARLMLIGEQPGDEEDQQGVLFVGPAGQLLNKILQEASIDRSLVYLTNAVKHFKWEARVHAACKRNPQGEKCLPAVPGWIRKYRW